jgi:hypothetical protein
MKKGIILAAAMVLGFDAAARADSLTSGGTLQLSGEVDASIVMKFHQHISGGGFSITDGDGTSAATTDMTTTSMYSTPDGPIADANFTKTTQSDGYTLTGTFDYQVDVANQTTSNFTLTANLQSSDSATWKLGTNTIVNGSDTTLTSIGTYALRTPVTLSVKFPKTMAAGAVGNTINFKLTAN